MALRLFLMITLLISPAGMMSGGLSVGLSERMFGAGAGMHGAGSDGAPLCCPLCEVLGSVDASARMNMGCGCGCGVSEDPIPDAPAGLVAVSFEGEGWEPTEVEITSIVALAFVGFEPGLVELGVESVGAGGGVTEFLAMTGHWIL